MNSEQKPNDEPQAPVVASNALLGGVTLGRPAGDVAYMRMPLSLGAMAPLEKFISAAYGKGCVCTEDPKGWLKVSTPNPGLQGTGHLDAKNAEIERLKIELENERDGHAWEMSPSMYEAKIERLHRVLYAVIQGVDKWAGDEDGVPSHLFEPYKAAKNVLSLYTPNPGVHRTGGEQ